MRASTALAAALLAGGGFGGDINAGAGPRGVEEVRPDLARIVKGEPGALEAFLPKADGTCEGWKRFRNPELKPLLLKLAEASDWHTAHRALFALEYLRDPAGLPAAWKLLFHSERRLREKAAITCVKLWDKTAAESLSRGDPRGGLRSALGTESDPHVKACFEALARRMEGKLPVDRVHEEAPVKGADGLLAIPFLDGMKGALKGVSQNGGGSAMKLPVAEAWTTPLLGYGQEEVAGAGLQPFGNPREGGRVHTGQDCGASLDGSGTYAAAEGIVRFINSGSDMGTLLVLEHHLDEKSVVCAVYMHGGDTVFVKAGERVAAGQLLGTMGMSFSPENGGHFAHLHYGLYPGPFQVTHNYGYKLAAAGLDDWLDPAKCLPRWKDGNRPKADEPAASITARALRVRQAGWPAKGLEVLTEGEKVLKGTPGAAVVAAETARWKGDKGFSKALAGERQVETVEEMASKAGPKDAEKVAAAWAGLLAAYGDTDLAPRIKDDMR